MIDKSIMLILTMYALMIGFLTVEFMINDVLHTNFVNANGDVLEPTLVTTWLNLENFNTISQEMVNGTFNQNTTFYNKVETYATAGAAVAWNFVALLTGLQMFSVLAFFGVPLPLVTGLAMLYVFLLARTIIGLLQRI